MFVIMTVGIFAQSAPSGYTSHLGLRLYAQAANPGADSLNQNALDIDAGVKANYDTVNALKADYYYQHNYDGSHQNGIITWDNLSTAAKSTIVQTSGTQVINGWKTFNSSSTSFRNIFPLADNSFYLGSLDARFAGAYIGSIFASNIYIYDPGKTDSALISFNGTKVSFDKDVEFSGITNFLPSSDGVGSIGADGDMFSIIWADTLASDSTLRLWGKQGGVHIKTELVTPPIEKTLADTSTYFDATSAVFIQLVSPDSVPSLSIITFSGMGGAVVEGQKITVMNMSNVNITLKHGTGSLRNIGSVDVVLGQYDSVEYILVDIGGSSYRWIMLNHSNI